MPSYEVDSIRQPMTATGIVEQVMESEETPEGKRRPSEKQAPNENTGMPLWAVEVRHIQTTFGRRSTVTAKVTVDAVDAVDAADEPTSSPQTPIGFNGLRVDVRVNKAGGFVEVWSADSLLEAPKSRPEPPSSPSSECSATPRRL